MSGSCPTFSLFIFGTVPLFPCSGVPLHPHGLPLSVLSMAISTPNPTLQAVLMVVVGWLWLWLGEPQLAGGVVGVG